MDATGLPGSPKKCADLIRPKASGRPGCIATCQKSIAPISASTSLTRSRTPTETPPEVTTMSPTSAASSSRARSSSRTSGTIPRSTTSPPYCSIAPRNVNRLAS